MRCRTPLAGDALQSFGSEVGLRCSVKFRPQSGNLVSGGSLLDPQNPPLHKHELARGTGAEESPEDIVTADLDS